VADCSKYRNELGGAIKGDLVDEATEVTATFLRRFWSEECVMWVITLS
jgi:hypothetical protein